MKLFYRTAPAVIAALALMAGAWAFASSPPALAQTSGNTATPGAEDPTEPSAEMTVFPTPTEGTGPTATLDPAGTPTAPAFTLPALTIPAGAGDLPPGTATAAGPTTAAGQATAAPSATAPAPGSATATPGAGTAQPPADSGARPAATAAALPDLQLPDGLPDNEQLLLRSLYGYSLDLSAVDPGGFGPDDRVALDVLWAQNAGGLEMLKFAAGHAQSARVRELVRVMGQMQLKDQALLDQFESQVSTCAGTSGTGGEPPCSSGSIQPGDRGASGAALSFSNIPVLPQSPLGALGFKTIDLKGAFMSPVTGAPASQFDPVFLAQMMAVHGFAIESAQTVQATAADSALRDLAGHLAQVKTLHRLLMLQLSDQLFYGKNLTIIFPGTVPITGQTPTAAPPPTETVSSTPAAETPTPPAETPIPTGTAPAGTPAPTGTAGATGTVVPTGTAAPTGTGTPSATATQGP